MTGNPSLRSQNRTKPNGAYQWMIVSWLPSRILLDGFDVLGLAHLATAIRSEFYPQWDC